MILLLRTTWAGKPRICIGAGVVVQKQDLDLRMVPGHVSYHGLYFGFYDIDSNHSHVSMAEWPKEMHLFQDLAVRRSVIASSH